MRHNECPYKSPPILHKEDGSSRRVGFELEFSGLSLEQASDALRASMGAKLRSETAAERTFQVEMLGEFSVELDWDFLKRTAQGTQGEDGWVQTLSQAAGILVPVEVVCPPIPIGKLDTLEPMVAALRDAGAVGTEESLLAAYGVHINVELPRLDAATLNFYLTAFCLLQWWLLKAHDVNPTRRVSFYIDLYSETYIKQVLTRPSPTIEDIFDDYLAHNASRNRALDLLPLLANIDEDRVRESVDDPKIKPRPAIHYRMPNCHIERSDWSLAGSWNIWWVVEQLANRPDDLNQLSSKFLTFERPMLGVSRDSWIQFIDQWLKDHALV